MAGTGEAVSRFREVIDGCRDAFIEYDETLVVTEWSVRAEQLLGWSRAEMVGRDLFACVSERYGETVEEGMAIVRSRVAARDLESLPVASRPLLLELELRNRSGDLFSATGSVFVTVAEDSPRIGVFVHAAAPASDVGPEDEPVRDRLHDPLTGLPNRTLFLQRLTAAIEDLEGAGGSVAVAGLGLRRFKAINDALGHEAGDDLLMAVASRLRRAGGEVRPTLARLAGDEFLGLFEHPGDGAGSEAESYAVRALAGMEIPFDVGGREVFVTASAGIASTTDPRTNPSTLLSDAEAAMHEGDPGGRSVRVFGEAMRRQVVDRLHIELALHRALDHEELVLHYQPVVDLAGCATVGMEALLRWHHPDHGLVGPDRFIPVAEESGLIVPIGAWVLAEACSQLQQWRQDGVGPSTGTVDVNLSARQIDHPDLLATVEAVLDATGLPPEHLTLEITESALMRDATSAMEVLGSLKRTGVSLAIDDFGTGYCSLSYLHRFPLDILKVDKAFVDGLDDAEGAEIVASVVGLAHALGLDVVAEGVETEHQLSILRQMGCDHAQGFLFSKAVPATELGEPFVADGPWFGEPAALGPMGDRVPRPLTPVAERAAAGGSGDTV